MRVITIIDSALIKAFDGDRHFSQKATPSAGALAFATTPTKRGLKGRRITAQGESLGSTQNLWVPRRAPWFPRPVPHTTRPERPQDHSPGRIPGFHAESLGSTENPWVPRRIPGFHGKSLSSTQNPWIPRKTPGFRDPGRGKQVLTHSHRGALKRMQAHNADPYLPVAGTPRVPSAEKFEQMERPPVPSALCGPDRKRTKRNLSQGSTPMEYG